MKKNEAILEMTQTKELPRFKKGDIVRYKTDTSYCQVGAIDMNHTPITYYIHQIEGLIQLGAPADDLTMVVPAVNKIHKFKKGDLVVHTSSGILCYIEKVCNDSPEPSYQVIGSEGIFYSKAKELDLEARKCPKFKLLQHVVAKDTGNKLWTIDEYEYIDGKYRYAIFADYLVGHITSTRWEEELKY